MSNGLNYSQQQFEDKLRDMGLELAPDGRTVKRKRVGKSVVRGVLADSTSGCGPESRVRLPPAPQAGAMQRARKQPIEIDGYKFPTAAEARRYRELCHLRDVGIVRDLEVHPWWQITVKGIDICRVVADFKYRQATMMVVIGEGITSWAEIVEDIKAERRDKVTGKLKFTTDTGRSKLGRKLVLACYGIEIRVIK